MAHGLPDTHQRARSVDGAVRQSPTSKQTPQATCLHALVAALEPHDQTVVMVRHLCNVIATQPLNADLLARANLVIPTVWLHQDPQITSGSRHDDRPSQPQHEPRLRPALPKAGASGPYSCLGL